MRAATLGLPDRSFWLVTPPGFPRDLFERVRSPFSIDCGLSNDPSKGNHFIPNCEYPKLPGNHFWLGNGLGRGGARRPIPHGHPI
ncbi:hypothetical protein CEXT_376711 [Caerostris extrusa]|uniref:Uncharacterized protein n=1 Tax=Caerostris extrusa TaxID=172846 RepID=A0AAV4NRB7_CAEEX|nr:hypothetical protein CEXT_376711 [Caerostris extrusa]